MEITQEKLKEIIVSHGKWLRDEESGERADLKGAYLEGTDLRGAYFRGANLRGANLKGADLRGTDLRRADLRGTDLEGANLESADLRYANLKGANLKGVDLRDVDLREADLKGAYLEDTYLGGAYLKGADLNKTYYQITRIGSRNATTTYCVEDDNVVCGCWNNYRGGTLEEFKKRVESVYGKEGEMPNKKYCTQYTAAIKCFEKMVKLAKMEEE